jgi:hypothetical protein
MYNPSVFQIKAFANSETLSPLLSQAVTGLARQQRRSPPVLSQERGLP